MKSTKEDLHHFQMMENEKLERAAFGLTLKTNERLEFSNGLTLLFKRKSGRTVRVVVIAPRDVAAYRPRKKADAEIDTDQG